MQNVIRVLALLGLFGIASGTREVTRATILTVPPASHVLTYTFTVAMLDGSQITATALTINHCFLCQAPNDWKLVMTVNGAQQNHRADSVVSVQWTH